VGVAQGGIFTLSDVHWYLKIAQGETSSVLQPFASRQMGPLVARALTNVPHVSIFSAFVIEGVISIVVLLGAVGFLLLRAGAKLILLAAIGGLALWAELFNGLALPDLWFAALLGIFLVLLYFKRYLAGALMLFPLFFSRESSILVLLCLLTVGWRALRPVDRTAAVIASIAGISLVKVLTIGGLSNQEQMSPLLYMAAKVPANFMKNVVGFPLWNNLSPGNCATPQWQMSLHLGGVRTVGVCGYEPANTLWTVIFALNTFGLLPLLLVYLWRRRLTFVSSEDVMLRFCLLYGVISYLLAPALGTGVPRLLSYAWPLFTVAVPVLATRHLTIPRLSAVALLGLHLAIAWSPMLSSLGKFDLTPGIYLLAIAGGYVGGWILLRQGRTA
jgi:hypothetical protein